MVAQQERIQKLQLTNIFALLHHNSRILSDMTCFASLMDLEARGLIVLGYLQILSTRYHEKSWIALLHLHC